MLYMYANHKEERMYVGDVPLNSYNIYDFPWRWKRTNKRAVREAVYQEYRANYLYFKTTRFWNMPEDQFLKNTALYITQKDLDRYKAKVDQCVKS